MISSRMWKKTMLPMMLVYMVTGRTIGEHAGIFSHDLEQAHLVVPRKVNFDGETLTNNLTHHHDGHNDSNLVHYQLEFHNETLHLELEPSTSFLGPAMIVERHKRDLRTRKKLHKNKNCHYQGTVRGHDSSKVAISACDGIAGFMRTKKGEYWIEPSKHHDYSKHLGHPHVVFHRSAVKTNNKPFNPNNKKKKMKRRRKRHPSNCGTKEPKRLAETRIEWQPQGKVIVQGGRKTRIHPNEYNVVGSDTKKKRRVQRSISQPHHVEALVVADPSMVMFHQDGDVETYLLTIMNMVSSLYKDPNIGNLINVAVVKILLLEEEDDSTNLNITHVAGSTLESFCSWQRELNPGEDDPYHHDVAILITRTNICSVSGCSTLGVANVGGMCKPDRSCSVNEDNGITLAHTITHELGHNFGMYHDTAKTGCDNRIGPILHIMTPSFEADTVQVSWSNCSRKYITNFLDQGKGSCLKDPPIADEYNYPELPAGAMYNADLQCRLQFNSTDETISVCSRPNEICSKLWCMVDGTCTTLLRPAAAGTHCEHHKWCQNQECVPVEELPEKIDGEWGAWSNWSDCSRTCDGGIAKQLRECNNPAPAFGGSFCVGERSRYKICNVEKCPKAELSFRAVQCSSYNNKTFKGQTYTWLPYFDIQTPCELLCTDQDDTMIVPFGDSAADGTPCNIGTNDMCIDGICRKVGCDWAVDSQMKEDQCGVCGGDGKTCTTIQGEFTETLDMVDGFHQIVIIPEGSRNIQVEEMDASKNYIGIGKANSDDFYLNGNSMIFMSGEYEIAGTMGLYERISDLEKLKIPGPIKHNISLNIIFRGKHKNLGVKYQYTLQTNSSLNSIVYWDLSDYTPCSATCGGGTKYKFPVCHQVGEGVVSDDDCVAGADNKKPEKIIQLCNEDPCPAFWWIGPWQLCQATCQKVGDTTPVRKRSIMCVDQNQQALPDARCDLESRPVDAEFCPGKLPFCSLDVDDDNEPDVPDDDNEENNTI